VAISRKNALHFIYVPPVWTASPAGGLYGVGRAATLFFAAFLAVDTAKTSGKA
jgi:hypothetical protein